jgi:hypothetical protein
MYKEQQHFPMRGESCFSFFRPCEYFGICNLKQLTGKVSDLVAAPTGAEAKIDGVEYYFSLSEIINSEMEGITS